MHSIHQELEENTGKNKIIKLRRMVRKSGMPLVGLINLTLQATEPQVAFRAAWLLEHVLIGKMSFYLNEIPGLIEIFPQITNPGCRRHYAKIMARITDPRSAMLQNIIRQTDMEKVVEACFDWLIDERARVAVQTFCMEVLYNLHQRYAWVREELPAQIEYVMEYGTAGIQAKGRKILSALR